MFVIKVVGLVLGICFLGSFLALSFWGIPSPTAPVERVVSFEKILP